MGIIKKQAIRSTALSFLGTAFGSLGRMILPFYFSTAQIGLLNMLDSLSGTFYSLFHMGYSLLLKKMFPHYRDEGKGHHGFLALGIIISVIGIILALGTYYLLEEWVISSKNDPEGLLIKFSFFIPPLIFIRIIGSNVDSYVKMLYNTVIGTFFETFLMKFMFFIGAILVATYFINFDQYLYLYITAFLLPGSAIILYALINAKKIDFPHSSLLKKKKEISTYLLFGILGGASNSIVLYIDQIMLNTMVSLSAVGVYSVMFFASNLIAIPSRNLRKISGVVVAEAWKENDVKEIENIYKKSSSNLLIIGIYLFFIGWWVLPVVLENYLIEYKEGLYVFFFLGIGKVFELASGINSDIIESSPKYKWSTYLNVIFAVLVFLTNLIFIPWIGLVGAGIASCISLVVINLIRWYFLKRNFGLGLYTPQFVKGLIFSVVLIAIASFVVIPVGPLWQMLIYFVCGSAFFVIVAYKLKLSDEVNEILYKIMLRFGLKK